MMDKENLIRLAAKLLGISEEESREYSHDIDGLDAVYISIPEKGGDSLVVGTDGTVLYANSSVSYQLHIDEFKKGTRTPLEAFGRTES